MHTPPFHLAVPDVPTITSINWINATSIQVTWTQLTLEESRGFITSYLVAYSTAERNSCSEVETNNTILTTHSESSQLIINNLDPNLEYCIGIAARTMSDTSDFSNKLKVPYNVSTTPPPDSTNGTDILTGTTVILAICLVAVGNVLLLITVSAIIIATILCVRRVKTKQM